MVTIQVDPSIKFITEKKERNSTSNVPIRIKKKQPCSQFESEKSSYVTPTRNQPSSFQEQAEKRLKIQAASPEKKFRVLTNSKKPSRSNSAQVSEERSNKDLTKSAEIHKKCGSQRHTGKKTIREETIEESLLSNSKQMVKNLNHNTKISDSAQLIEPTLENSAKKSPKNSLLINPKKPIKPLIRINSDSRKDDSGFSGAEDALKQTMGSPGPSTTHLDQSRKEKSIIHPYNSIFSHPQNPVGQANTK